MKRSDVLVLQRFKSNASRSIARIKFQGARRQLELGKVRDRFVKQWLTVLPHSDRERLEREWQHVVSLSATKRQSRPKRLFRVADYLWASEQRVVRVTFWKDLGHFELRRMNSRHPLVLDASVLFRDAWKQHVEAQRHVDSVNVEPVNDHTSVPPASSRGVPHVPDQCEVT